MLPGVIVISTERSKVLSLLTDDGTFTVNRLNPEEDFSTADMDVYEIKKSTSFVGPQFPRDFVVATTIDDRDRVNKFAELLVRALWYNDGMGFAINNDEVAFGKIFHSFETPVKEEILFKEKFPVSDDAFQYIMSFGGAGVLSLSNPTHPMTKMFISVRPPYLMVGVICKYMVYCCDSFKEHVSKFFGTER